MTLASVVEPSESGHEDAPVFPIATLRRLTLVLLAAFGALAVFVAVTSDPTSAERSVDRLLSSAPGSAMFDLGRLVSFMGSAGVVTAAAVLLAALVWVSSRRWRLALVCLAGPALAGIGEIVLKTLVGRPRPSTGLLTGLSGNGFPSGHTSGAAALATVVVIASRSGISSVRTRRVIVGAAVLYAVAVGISRVVVGAHYGLDVVGGWLFGPAAALVAFLAITSLSSDAWGAWRRTASSDVGVVTVGADDERPASARERG
jgi:undecaprenyl-diphosphatase